MSALEQALRQIEQDRQARKGSGSVRGVMPGIMLDSLGKPKQSRRGLLFAVVALSLACGGTWLMMLGFLPVGPEDLSRWGRSIPSVSALFTRTKKMSPQVQTTDEPSVSDATPAASAQPPKGSASLPITVSASAANPVQPPQVGSPVAAQPGLPLKPAMTAPAAAPVQQFAPAPVATPPATAAAAPKPMAAVPAAPPATASVSKPVLVAAAPPPVALKPAVPTAAPLPPKPVAALASPNASALIASTTKSDDDESELASKPATTSKADAEPPQLSRTDADRLSATGPVSSAAKAIDVDYQMIERSLARGDHQAALESVGKLEKYIGENWRTRYLAGVALMGLSRWDQAIVSLSKAQDLNPTHAMSALYLSVALQERGEHSRAIQVLDRALASLPQSSELWLNLGHSHDALGHKAEAKTAYTRFMELSVNRQDLAGQRVWVQNRLQKDK